MVSILRYAEHQTGYINNGPEIRGARRNACFPRRIWAYETTNLFLGTLAERLYDKPVFKWGGFVLCSDSGSATSKVMISNERVRVTEWRFQKLGDNTGWHRHAYDYVVIPLFDGILKIDVGQGELVKAQMQNGVPYFREIGVEHDVINGNDFECAFVEVELLQSRNG